LRPSSGSCRRSSPFNSISSKAAEQCLPYLACRVPRAKPILDDKRPLTTSAAATVAPM
jgi:hypothetical protein